MAKKVVTHKSTFDRFNEGTQHDELIGVLAEQNGAHPAEVFRIQSRTVYEFAWVWLVAGVSLGLGGMATGGGAGVGIFLVVLGLLALPIIIWRKNKLRELRSLPTQQTNKSMTPEEERTTLKDEVRREMLKEELRKEIEAENKK